MKAFWTIAVATIAEGARAPDLDFGGEWHYAQTNGDLVVGKESAGAGNHRHSLVGPYLVPQTDGHYHLVIPRTNGTIYQEMIDSSGEVGDHNHTGDLWPDFYLCFVLTTDQGAANLLANNSVREIASYEVVDNSIGDIIDTLYTPQELTWLSGKMNDWLGLQMPVIIDRPSRWVEWIVQISQAPVVRNERDYRMR